MHSESDTLGSLAALRECIERASDYLPAQGPISVIVHHNTPHALESQDFFGALRSASQIYGCHPLLSEDEFRSELAADRITKRDIEHALIEDLGERDDELIEFLGTRLGRHDPSDGNSRRPSRTSSASRKPWGVLGGPADFGARGDC